MISQYISTSCVLLIPDHSPKLYCMSVGKYIFEEPLQHYWAEKRAEEIAAKEGNSTNISPPTSSTISSDKTK